MRGIFISYRREDTEGQAGRLFDDLSSHFGRDAVFMDVAGIKKGLDFRRIIQEHVTSCGVLLVLIGKDWLTVSDRQGKKRLDDPNDFVRLETAAALSRDIPVVPVLVQGAAMPAEKELPDALRELAFRNGAELTHARWDSDVEALIGDLKPYLESTASADTTQPHQSPAGSNETPSRKSVVGRYVWAAGAATVIVGGVAGYLLLPNSTPPDASAKVAPQVVPQAAVQVAPAIEQRSLPTPSSKIDPPASPKPLNELAKSDPPSVDPDAVKVAAAKAAADAAAKAAAAKAAAARKEADDRRRREEAARAAQLAEEQQRRDEEQQQRRAEEQRRRAEEQRKQDEENRKLAQERAEKERIAAEQAAAARFFTEFATAVIGGRQNYRR